MVPFLAHSGNKLNIQIKYQKKIKEKQQQMTVKALETINEG